jgi:carbon-monoxide dehydrogenase medium subunit
MKAAEAILSGHRIDETLLRRAADEAVGEAEFVADVRGSVPYKRELMRVYVRRALQAAWAETGRSDGHA